MFMTLLRSDNANVSRRHVALRILSRFWWLVKVIWFYVVLPLTICRQVSQVILLLTTPNWTFMDALNLLRWRVKHVCLFVAVVAMHCRQTHFLDVFRSEMSLTEHFTYLNAKRTANHIGKRLWRFDIVFTIISTALVVLAAEISDMTFYVFKTTVNATDVYWPVPDTLPAWTTEVVVNLTVNVLVFVEGLTVTLFCVLLYSGVQHIKVLQAAALLEFRHRSPSETDLNVLDGQLDAIKMFRVVLEKTFGIVLTFHIGTRIVTLCK